MNREDIKRMILSVCHKLDVDVLGGGDELLEELIDIAAKNLIDAFKNAMLY